ncbi:MAG: PHP domain-containing protein [Chloroflexi bacterium]|nr:PHP domain-containing protein [Chloroflexota bacterium]
MRADLHTHTLRSDGLLPPAELVHEARQAGLDCLAVTDHDSLAALDEAAEAARELGIGLIAGAELSVRDARGNDDHLLGFFVDPTAPALKRYLEALQESRSAMAQQTLDALRELGLPVSAERVAELASGAVVTRPHIARAMVEAGYVQDEREAFDRYLGSGRPAAPERPTPDHATAIATVREAGGVAALAHPVFPRDANAAERQAGLDERLGVLREAGLQAMECFYPDATPDLSAALVRLAESHDLIPTGGSDYHGPGKAPFAALGEVSVDEATVARLERARTGFRT